jgi:hypothetical protein
MTANPAVTSYDYRIFQLIPNRKIDCPGDYWSVLLTRT